MAIKHMKLHPAGALPTASAIVNHAHFHISNRWEITRPQSPTVPINNQGNIDYSLLFPGNNVSNFIGCFTFFDVRATRLDQVTGTIVVAFQQSTPDGVTRTEFVEVLDQPPSVVERLSGYVIFTI